MRFSDTKFILVLNGPLCAGKSTVTKLVAPHEDVFRASQDKIKWLIGGYDANNESHRDLVKK